MVIFTVDGVKVGQTRSRKQRTIVKLMQRLAALYVGKTVEAHYPQEA